MRRGRIDGRVGVDVHRHRHVEGCRRERGRVDDHGRRRERVDGRWCPDRHNSVESCTCTVVYKDVGECGRVDGCVDGRVNERKCVPWVVRANGRDGCRERVDRLWCVDLRRKRIGSRMCIERYKDASHCGCVDKRGLVGRAEHAMDGHVDTCRHGRMDGRVDKYRCRLMVGHGRGGMDR
jgi:hypothetical protein